MQEAFVDVCVCVYPRDDVNGEDECCNVTRSYEYDPFLFLF